MNYLKQHAPSMRTTPQSSPLRGRGQVMNAAGGFAFPVTDEVRFERFLILGSEGGTYYASERKLTTENIEAVHRYIDEHGPEAVALLWDIYEHGRAAKQSPTLYALALACASDNVATRQAAFACVPRLRTFTQLAEFVGYAEQHRGWGKLMKRAVAAWYLTRSPYQVAFQAVKYRNREGWTHRDLLRLAHPKTDDNEMDLVLAWAADKSAYTPASSPPPIIAAFEAIQDPAKPLAETIELIEALHLPREALPSALLGEPSVWAAMLPQMGLTALLRNLANMTRIGLLNNMGPHADVAIARLTDKREVEKARLHPLNVLVGALTYGSGRGLRGKHTWNPIGKIQHALDETYFAAFNGLEERPEGVVVALDVSGSMHGGAINGVPGLTPALAGTALAQAILKQFPRHEMIAFAAGAADSFGNRAANPGRWAYGGASSVGRIGLTAQQRLDDAQRYIHTLTMSGGTDCSLPMLWAIENEVKADGFVIITDNETWAGVMHPVQALQRYRDSFNPKAKLIVVALTSTGYSIADPDDAGMLDIVGFDAGMPTFLSRFLQAEPSA